MGNNQGFGERDKKAFDFASEVVKQQITLATAILALLVAVARILLDDLDSPDIFFLISASVLFFFSILMGVWTLMGLTYQLTKERPSIFDSGLRGKATLQAVLFLIGIMATVAFGITTATAQDADVGEILTQQEAIAALFPKELQQHEHALALATVLAKWNSGSLKLPSKRKLQPILESRLKQAVSSTLFGYENDVWAKRRLDAFDKLPAFVTPDKPLNENALRAILWAFAINLPFVEQKYKPGRLIEENPLPFYLLFGEAQQLSANESTKTITVLQVQKAVFKWWTNDWPFCRGAALKIETERAGDM